MPGRRRMAPLLLSRRQRLGVAVGAVVLLYLVVGMWAAFGRRPEAAPLVPAPPIFPDGFDSSTGPAPALPSDPGSGPASPSGDPSRAAPSEPGDDDNGSGSGAGDQGGQDQGGGRDEESPPPAELFTSRYTVTESGTRTFHARVFLTNRGQTTRDWSVRISFAPSDQVRVGLTLGAVKRSSGNTFVFNGFNARPGQTEIFGFDAAKGVSGTVRPTGCEVGGRACDIRVG
jgi:cellulose binding protein with CBM2 domain